MRLSWRGIAPLLVVRLVRRNLILASLGFASMPLKIFISKIMARLPISLRLILIMSREKHFWMLILCKVKSQEGKNRKSLSRYVPLCHKLSKKSLIFKWDILIQKLSGLLDLVFIHQLFVISLVHKVISLNRKSKKMCKNIQNNMTL